MPNSVIPVFGLAGAAPTLANEYHQAGELLINESPATGEPQGWVCTVAGYPGTWLPLNGIPASALHNVTVSITAAEVAALRATPKTLVAAPGAGYVLQLIHADLFLDYTAPGYTESSDNLAIRYTDGSGVIVSQAIECTGFIDQTADTMTSAFPKIDAIAAKSASENKALVLHNTGDGEFGGSGGSSLRLNLTYRVVPTGW